MAQETLYVVTCISNPVKWQSRTALARAAIADWLKEPSVHVTVAECLFGSDSNYLLADMASARVQHVPLRATTAVWAKEDLLNIAISRLPNSAAKIATLDADVTFRASGWGDRVIHELNLYKVIQPWTQALDLGPQDQVMTVHTSFSHIWHLGKPIIPIGTKFWTDSSYTYPHPGYAWAWQRQALDRIGGLYDQSGMGAADHTMAVAMVGQWQRGVQKGMSDGYKKSVQAWSDRAFAEVQGRIGYLGDTIEHPWHGSKPKRGYQSRWDNFVEAGFDPNTDIKKNTYGVLEFAGNKPKLEIQWMNYLKSRSEDANVL